MCNKLKIFFLSNQLAIVGVTETWPRALHFLALRVPCWSPRGGGLVFPCVAGAKERVWLLDVQKVDLQRGSFSFKTIIAFEVTN